MPLYTLILFGMIYFGYATITKSRQTVAASGAAWMSGEQTPEDLTEEFWRLAGNTLEDTTIECEEDVRLDDAYYGNLVETQLVAGIGSLGGGGNDTFDRERITVSLWNLALGEVTQRFVFEPGQGFVERINTHYDDYARYLNMNASGGTGFIDAREGAPPQIGAHQNWIADAINGFGEGHWIERRQVAIDVTYRPPFFKQVVREPSAPPTDLPTFISGDYAEPLEEPLIRMTFDVTGRGEGHRYAAGEQGTGGEDIVSQTNDLLQKDLPLEAADAMDPAIIATVGDNPWVAQ